MANDIWKVLAVIAVVVLVFDLGGVRTSIFAIKTPEPTVTGSVQALSGGVCGLEDISFTPSAVRMGRLGTAMPDGHRLFVVGGDGSIVDNGVIANLGSTTLSVGQKYKLLMAENSSTYYTKPVGYAAYGGEKDVDCQDPYRIQGVTAINGYSGGVSAPTITFKNSAGTASTAQAIGAGETQTVSLKIRAGADSCLTNPDSNRNLAISCRYNKTDYLRVEFREGKKISTPSWVTLPYADFQAETYELPDKLCDGLGLPSEKEYLIDVEAKTSTTNPTSHANCTLVDADFDVNAQTLDLIDGYEDEDGNNIGATNETTINVTMS